MNKSPFQIQTNNHFDLTHGFLPSEDPLQSLPKAFSEWETLASQLPKFLTSHRVRQFIENLPDFKLNKLKKPEEFERAMLILSYLAHAYVWFSSENPIKVLPKKIALPWHAISETLGRPPVLSYASYALYNWRRLIPNQPIELDNIVLLQNFLGGIDEEWFILIHIDIEQKAISGLREILPAQASVEHDNFEALSKQLNAISLSLRSMCDTLDRMPERCDPYIYFNRVRPYIHGWKDNPALPDGLLYEGVAAYNNEPQKFKGETGAQSTIIPSLDTALGITHAENPLKIHLDEMRNYMPSEHRAFLKKVECGASLRQYVKNRPHGDILQEEYNACIRLITRFRITHLKYAAQYIQKQHQTVAGNPNAVGTGGTPFMEYLRKHEEETLRFCI